MATYTHQMAEGNVRSGFMSGAATAEYRTAEFNVKAADLAAGNVFEFMRLPADAIVLDVFLTATELDTDGSATLTIHVGHDGDNDVFLAASTIGQTGGTVAATGGLPLLPRDPTDPTTDPDDPFSPAEEGTVISATLAAAAATGADGRLALTVGYVRTR